VFLSLETNREVVPVGIFLIICRHKSGSPFIMLGGVFLVISRHGNRSPFIMLSHAFLLIRFDTIFVFTSLCRGRDSRTRFLTSSLRFDIKDVFEVCKVLFCFIKGYLIGSCQLEPGLHMWASQVRVSAKDFGAKVVSVREVIRITKIIRSTSQFFQVKWQSNTDKVLLSKKGYVQSTLLVDETHSPSNNRAKEDTWLLGALE